MGDNNATTVAAVRVQREAHAARVLRAKKIHSDLALLINSATGAVLPASVKALLASMSLLLVDLADLSHGRFETAPFDLGELTHRVDALSGLTRSQTEVPADG